jgi:hypothetical protein
MTTFTTHAANQPHPAGFDSIDFYTRNGHRLHARAAGESFAFVLRLLRGLGRRSGRQDATWRA